MSKIKIRTIYPPEIVDISRRNITIFLGGPIQGAKDWQSEAIKILKERIPKNIVEHIVIANPRRDYIDENFEFKKQVDWESYYLEQASYRGVIMFWLARESEHICSRAYAQTSRWELSEWFQKKLNNFDGFVIGIEEGFSGKKYIEYRIEKEFAWVVEKSLDTTCDQVVEQLKIGWNW